MHVQGEAHDVAGVRAGLEACVAPAASARSIPPDAYTSTEIARWEQQAIFDRGWVGVGRSDRWAAGSVIAVVVGNVGIIVTRDESGGLHAMANSCRHRGAEVVVAEESCTRFRCGFHGWTYALDGRLVGAPHMQESSFERDTHGLVPFSCEERFGFVFVSLEADPPSIDDELVGFGDIHRAWPLADLRSVRRREFTVGCNWKAFAEVFNEYYHLPYVHPDSIDDTYLDPDPAEEVSGSFATQFGPTNGKGSLLNDHQGLNAALPTMPGLTGREASGVRYTWLFPSLIVAVGQDCLWMYEVYPDGPDRCSCAQVVAFPASTIDSPDFDAVIDSYYERFDLALAEDIPILEQQHRGLQSPAAQQGPFSHLEANVATFANWYATRMLETNAP